MRKGRGSTFTKAGGGKAKNSCICYYLIAFVPTLMTKWLILGWHFLIPFKTSQLMKHINNYEYVFIYRLMDFGIQKDLKNYLFLFTYFRGKATGAQRHQGTCYYLNFSSYLLWLLLTTYGIHSKNDRFFRVCLLFQTYFPPIHFFVLLLLLIVNFL